MGKNYEKKARALGINHVVLEVDNLEKALEFYGSIFEYTLRGKSEHNAFIDLGDQFIQLTLGRSQVPDTKRHFGLVVDDRDAVRVTLAEAGIEPEPGRGLRVRDPWGNVVEIVDYREVQFTKAPGVLAGMSLGGLEKTEAARRELAEKGLSPPTAGSPPP